MPDGGGAGVKEHAEIGAARPLKAISWSWSAPRFKRFHPLQVRLAERRELRPGVVQHRQWHFVLIASAA